MEELLQHIQDILGVPEFLINQCSWLPELIKEPLLTSINFIPWLFFLYYIIELVERFFMKHIDIFVKLTKRFGALFGACISTIPECGYQVVVANFYSRKMITKGTLLAFFIACSDDALPLLFLNLDKAVMIIPLVVIKLILAVLVGVIVDLMFAFNTKLGLGLNFVNTDLSEPACCHHRITNSENAPYWWTHPLVHTFNMFMFTLLSLIFIDIVINGLGGVENVSKLLMTDSPISIIVCAIFGLIPNCVVSIFLALLFVKEIISFPAFMAGMITVTGLGLGTLLKRQRNNADNAFITIVLLLVGIVTGLVAYYCPQLINAVIN